MRHSLLFAAPVDKKNCVTRELFEEIHLAPLLSEHAMEILSLPATAEDILLRHAVFSSLEDPAFYHAASAFSEALTSLWQANEQHKKASNPCERLLTFYALSRRFLFTCRIGANIRADKPELCGFTEHLQKLLPLANELEPQILKLEATLDEVYTSRLYFNPLGVHAMQDRSEDGILKTLQICANSLNLCEISLPEQRNLAMPHELSETLLEIYPQEFTAIRNFEKHFAPLPVEDLFAYRNELNFYFSVFELITKAKVKNIPVCYPRLSEKACFLATNAYDISLLDFDDVEIVPNDIYFSNEDTFFFLTGANGGGKTTYLRTVCGNLLLASRGCPMLADSATVFPFSTIGVHFPIDETTQNGRLAEEQRRTEELFQSAVEPAFFFFNETFSGANDRKGLVLTLDCAQDCKNRGIFALFVTHFHEVGGHGFPLLNTQVDASDQNKRTYKILRDTGLKTSYAEDVLRKYNLSKDTLHLREVNQ